MNTDTALIILPDTRIHALPVLERRVSVLAEPIGEQQPGVGSGERRRSLGSQSICRLGAASRSALSGNSARAGDGRSMATVEASTASPCQRPRSAATAGQGTRDVGIRADGTLFAEQGAKLQRRTERCWPSAVKYGRPNPSRLRTTRSARSRRSARPPPHRGR